MLSWFMESLFILETLKNASNIVFTKLFEDNNRMDIKYKLIPISLLTRNKEIKSF